MVENLDRLITVYPDNYELAQKHLLLHMYTDMIAPLRLDFGSVYLLPESGGTIPSSNWIHLKDYVFYLGHDKVSYKIGGGNFFLPMKLVQIILDMEKKFPGRRYLLTDLTDRSKPLVDTQHDPTHKRALVKLLKHIPLPNTDTVPSYLTVDSLRSSFVSYFYTLYNSMPTMETQILIAQQMRTSVQQMQTSYYKTNISRKI